MFLPEDEFELWHNRRWMPVHKSDLRRGDVFRVRGFDDAVMRLMGEPKRDADGHLVFDVRLDKKWKRKTP